MSFYVEQDFGHYEVTARMMSREDAIQLANLLRTADSDYLQQFGLEIESELMEVAHHE